MRPPRNEVRHAKRLRTLGSGFLLLLSALLLNRVRADWTRVGAVPHGRFRALGRLRIPMGRRFAHGGPMPRAAAAPMVDDGSPREPGRRIIPRRYGWNEGGRRITPAIPLIRSIRAIRLSGLPCRRAPHPASSRRAKRATGGPPAIHHTHHAGGNDQGHGECRRAAETRHPRRDHHRIFAGRFAAGDRPARPVRYDLAPVRSKTCR